LPTNWQEFLSVDDNKTDLLHFLADTCVSISDKIVVMTSDDHVKLCSGAIDVSSIEPCSHEEADTRLILHCRHAATNGTRRIAIRTVDTDVVVLAIAYFNRLEVQELWVHFGVGKSVPLLAIHEISQLLGNDKCIALPMFHALTGCDTVSCFNGKGKQTAWVIVFLLSLRLC